MASRRRLTARVLTALPLLFEVVKRRAEERVGSPFKRGDDFFVVIEAGGVFQRDDGMGAEGEGEGAPEPLAGRVVQPFAQWPECADRRTGSDSVQAAAR